MLIKEDAERSKERPTFDEYRLLRNPILAAVHTVYVIHTAEQVY